MAEEYMSTKEVATELGMKEGAVRDLVRRFPNLAPVKILGRLAWTRHEMADLKTYHEGIEAGTRCKACGKPVELAERFREAQGDDGGPLS